MVHVLGILPLVWEASVDFSAFTLGLARPWLLWVSRRDKWIEGLWLSLYLSVCFSRINKSFFLKKAH